MWYPARYIRLCNLLSYTSLLSGMLAAFAARAFGSWEGAGVLLAISALADTFDGKFARLFSRTESETAFGGQLDSLVDAVCFGIVPAVCLDSLVAFESNWSRLVFVTAAFFYVLCAVTRLGYFNVHNHAQSGFIGLPTTLAALLWSTLFALHLNALNATVILIALGLAMVSPLPIARPRGITMWAYMLWFVAVFAFYAR